MKRNLIVIAAILGTIALAQAVTGYKLNINNKSFSSPAIVVKGETYVPLKALQAAGVRSSLSGGTLTLSLPNAPVNQGGANQSEALEGCLNEWLFNGVWRFRATSLEPFKDGDRSGWRVAAELRNGTKADNIALSGTGFTALQLALSDGNQISVYNVTDLNVPVAQGASIRASLVFYSDDPNEARTPTKLLLLLKPSASDVGMLRSVGVSYSTSDPSFRVKLDCTK
jgi:hypothetical protein